MRQIAGRITRSFVDVCRAPIVRAAVLLTVVTGLTGCKETDCGFDSEAVVVTRGLSQERLARLYRDMERDHYDLTIPRSGWGIGSQNTDLPERYNDLAVVRVSPALGNIMLNGCFDHYSMLYFHGFGEADPARRFVELIWGEPHSQGAGKWVIWRANSEVRSLPEKWPVDSN